MSFVDLRDLVARVAGALSPQQTFPAPPLPAPAVPPAPSLPTSQLRDAGAFDSLPLSAFGSADTCSGGGVFSAGAIGESSAALGGGAAPWSPPKLLESSGASSIPATGGDCCATPTWCPAAPADDFQNLLLQANSEAVANASADPAAAVAAAAASASARRVCGLGASHNTATETSTSASSCAADSGGAAPFFQVSPAPPLSAPLTPSGLAPTAAPFVPASLTRSFDAAGLSLPNSAAATAMPAVRVGCMGAITDQHTAGVRRGGRSRRGGGGRGGKGAAGGMETLAVAPRGVKGDRRSPPVSQSVHPRNKGVVCKLYAETCGSCPVANCPYSHMAPDLELPLPAAMCRFHRTKACLRDGCTMFHGSQQQLAALNASGAATYRPADLLPQRDPLEPLSEMELTEALKDRGLLSMPQMLPGAPARPPLPTSAPTMPVPPPTAMAPPSPMFAPATPPGAAGASLAGLISLTSLVPAAGSCNLPPLGHSAGPAAAAGASAGSLLVGGLLGGSPMGLAPVSLSAPQNLMLTNSGAAALQQQQLWASGPSVSVGVRPPNQMHFAGAAMMGINPQ